MAVRMRLTRMGRKKRPFYRIVVADAREPRDGKYIECIGTYNPIVDPVEVNIVDERAAYWLQQGAQPSDTVYNLLQRKGIIFKRHLQKKGLDEAQINEEMKKWDVMQIERQRKAEAVKADKVKAKPAAAEKAPVAEVEEKPEETVAEA